MEENVTKELDCLKQMVINWRQGYLEWVEPGEDNSWIVQELKDEIQEYMAPYIRRFRDLAYITHSEEAKFWQEVLVLVDCFEDEIKLIKKEPEPKVDVKGLYNKFLIHRDLVQGGQCDPYTTLEQRMKLSEIAIVLIPALMKNQCKCGGNDDTGKESIRGGTCSRTCSDAKKG